MWIISGNTYNSFLRSRLCVSRKSGTEVACLVEAGFALPVFISGLGGGSGTGQVLHKRLTPNWLQKETRIHGCETIGI
jgi:hypothetical protein